MYLFISVRVFPQCLENWGIGNIDIPRSSYLFFWLVGSFEGQGIVHVDKHFQDDVPILMANRFNYQPTNAHTYVCICWLIIKVILRNTRYNNKDIDGEIKTGTDIERGKMYVI